MHRADALIYRLRHALVLRLAPPGLADRFRAHEIWCIYLRHEVLQSGIADHNLQSAASARAAAHNWKTKSAARASATPLAA